MDCWTKRSTSFRKPVNGWERNKDDILFAFDSGRCHTEQEKKKRGIIQMMAAQTTYNRTALQKERNPFKLMKIQSFAAAAAHMPTVLATPF